MNKYCATLLGLGLAAVPASAVPSVRVQGTLADAGGRAVTGRARLDFRLVDPVSKTEAWSEPLEVSVVKGVFVAALGLREPLPSPQAVRPTWRLVAEAPMGSGWSVGALTEAEDDLRDAHLARLMLRLGLEPSSSASAMAPQYRRLLGGAAGGHAPPEAVSAAPECAEGASAVITCPRDLQKVLGREERLLRARLARLARDPGPRAEARAAGLTAR